MATANSTSIVKDGGTESDDPFIYGEDESMCTPASECKRILSRTKKYAYEIQNPGSHK